MKSFVEDAHAHSDSISIVVSDCVLGRKQHCAPTSRTQSERSYLEFHFAIPSDPIKSNWPLYSEEVSRRPEWTTN